LPPRYRIGGIEDHVHILTSLHPSSALSDLIKEIKTGTNHWIKSENVFPEFRGWQTGYGAFTCSANEKDRIIEYIKDQEGHHRRETAPKELKRLLAEAGIKYDEKYFE
jgi:REP element-mobilizing transposase RayT